MVQSDLIFDIGMHRGDDAGFYLAKGFRVVSVEPHREYADLARSKFDKQLASNRFTVIDKAMTSGDPAEITFYVNQQKDDSHTTRQDVVSANRAASVFSYQEVTVSTITLPEMFDVYGVPYYLKCDIEGGDDEVLNQLLKEDRRPSFISFEAQELDILAKMRAAGYNSFQLVNQYFNPTVQPPKPPREGDFAAVQFTGHMSGLFGCELPIGKWMSFRDAAKLYLLWLELQERGPDLATGWCDFHATAKPVEELAEPHILPV